MKRKTLEVEIEGQGVLTLPPLTPPYTNDLAQRLLAFIEDKRKEAAPCGRKRDARFSLARLSRKSGIKYEALINYVVRRNRTMSLQVVDSLMYGLGINVLDLVQPHELATKFLAMDSPQRVHTRKIAKAQAASGKSSSTPST